MTDAAWLADPTHRHHYRYWDGTRWTDHVADDGVVGHDPVVGPPPASAPGTAAPSPATSAPATWASAPTAARTWEWRPAAVALLVGAVLAGIGSVGPWIEVTAGVFSRTFNGTGDGRDGTITLVAALAILVVALVTASTTARSGTVVIAVLAGLVVAGTGITDAIDVSKRASELSDVNRFVDARVGWGLWLTIAGGVIAFVAGIVRIRQLAGASRPVLPAPGPHPPTSGDADGYL
jgi:hypothetical protein